MGTKRSEIRLVFDSFKSDVDSTALSADTAFRALQSLFGEDILKRHMFDRFNKKGEVTVHDLAILLIQLDTFFEVCLLEDLGIEIPVKKERARSLLRAVSTSIK